jgi:hypothetical protein
MSYARQMLDTYPRTFSVDTDLQPSMAGPNRTCLMRSPGGRPAKPNACEAAAVSNAVVSNFAAERRRGWDGLFGTSH